MAIQHFIEECFVFRGLLFLQGWCFESAGSPLRILLQIAQYGEYPVELEWLPSPDVGALHGAHARQCRFDAHIELPRGLAEELGLATKLKLVADNGAELLLEHPSWRCLASDGFMDLQALVSAVAEYRGLSEFEPPPRQADPWSNSLDVFQYAMALLAPGRILEIGSRARSGIVRRQLFGALDYTGMDVLAGPNVDLVGDAHQLGAYFKADCFDFIMSVSVFEHLMKPWRVVEQMNRVLKPGGLVMINTHQSWPVHDAPWDFHRFSEFSWVSLFNEQSGFEIIQAVMGEPCIIVPTQLAEGYRGLQQQRGFLSSRCIARKTAEADRSDLSRPDTRVYPSYPA